MGDMVEWAINKNILKNEFYNKTMRQGPGAAPGHIFFLSKPSTPEHGGT